ncbi:hypothetical protein MVEN_02247900 [Mycena venus]|uniref:Uncharacterized protein n=1 Tax=Mycena venus TaxID=2733690 RepID=A0A8H6X686_9AGAR|nr:hypothetical protein MVEN_02247900 [Mycena venus]
MLQLSPIETFLSDVDCNSFEGPFNASGPCSIRSQSHYSEHSHTFANRFTGSILPPQNSSLVSSHHSESQYQWPMSDIQPDPSFNILTSATHSDLFYTNAPYTNLFHEYNNLQERLTTLQCVISNDRVNPDLDLNLNLTLAATIDSLQLADRTAYPNVRYWDRVDFNKANKSKKTTHLNSGPAPCGNKRVAEDINIMTWYIKKEDGSIVSGKEAQAIRTTQLAIYRDIQRISPGDLPKTWGTASLTVVNYHRAQMYAAYLFLRLCNSHWKVDHLATNTYSSWYTKAVKKKAKTNSIGHDGCVCVCTCATASANPSDNEDDDNVSILASTSASTSRSTSSALPSTQASKKRRSKVDFIPSGQPQKRWRTSPFPETFDIPTPDPSIEPSEPSTSSPDSQSSSTSQIVPSPNPIESTAVLIAPASSLLSSAVITPSALPETSSAPSTETLSTTLTPSINASNAREAAPPPVTIIKPLDAAFGVAVGLAERSNGITNVVVPPPTSTTTTTKKPKKRPNKDSLSPANLFYQNFLKTNDAVTTEEFDVIFGALSLEQLKKWTDLSTEQNKAKKAAKLTAATAATTVELLLYSSTHFLKSKLLDLPERTPLINNSL